MLGRFRKLAAFLVLLSLMAVPAAAGPLEDGAAAYEQGDYATALRLWRPLNAGAQFALGIMYDEGQGVPKDDREAVRWYRMAAEQANASAQFNLGNVYYNGQGVPKDYVQAYTWWNLAAAQGEEDAGN